MSSHATTPFRELTAGIIAELYHSECSASAHPKAEADRLRGTVAGCAMAEIATEADDSLVELEILANARGFFPRSQNASQRFSRFREGLTERALSAEMSYRMTLLGVRHGIDLVRSLWELAMASEDKELVSWCDTWLVRRFARVAEAEGAMSWFAQNPERALQPVKPSPVSRLARAVFKALHSDDLGTPSHALRQA